MASAAAKAVTCSDSFSLDDWEFSHERGPILNTEEFTRWEAELFTLPEMVFGQNCLLLQHRPSGTCFRFRAREALECCIGAKAPAELSYADVWKNKSSISMEGWASDSVKASESNFDWTYCSDYKGQVFKQLEQDNIEHIPATESASAVIDYDMLRQPDQILFHNEMILYEDELHDNGMTTLSVRMRVMGKCFFVLLRVFLRMDNSIVRVHDTRFFHKFGDDHVVREIKVLEKNWAPLTEDTQGVVDAHGKCGPYADVNMLIPHLSTLAFITEKIQL